MNIVKRIWLILFTGFLVVAQDALAQEEENKRIIAAAEVIEELTKIPEGIPPDMIRSAKGIAIIPNVIKGGFILGGRFGRGVLLVRKNNGLFSAPLFVTMGGGSLGFQAGVQGMDLVLVFRTQKALTTFYKAN